MFDKLKYNSDYDVVDENGAVTEHLTYDFQTGKTFSLKEFAATPEYLVGTCQSAQDFYTEWIKYFNPALLEDIHS